MESSPEHRSGVLTTQQAQISPDNHQAPAKQRRRQRWVRLLWMVVLPVLGVILGATNTQFGRDQVRDVLEAQLSDTLVDTQVTIGSLEGNLLRGAIFRDVHLYGREGEDMLQLDVLEVDYRLAPLLRARAELVRVVAKGLHVEAAQSPDGQWDWATLLPASEEESSWAVSVDSLDLEKVSATARFYSPSHDSLLAVHDLQLSMAGLDLPASEDPRLGSLVLRSTFQPPVRMDTVRIALKAAYADDVIRLDTLSLRSARSYVEGGGNADLSAIPLFAFQPSEPLPSGAESSLRIDMRPLALADLAVFAPALDERARLDADLVVTQSGGDTELDFDMRVRDGGDAKAAMRWTQGAGGAALTGSLQLERFDVDHLTMDSLGVSPLTATLTIDVQGSTLDSLSGAVKARVDPIVVVGQPVDSTRITAELVAGSAIGELVGGIAGMSMRSELGGRWFDENPSFTIEGQINEFDVAPWVASETISSDVSLALDGFWKGSGVETASAGLDVGVLPSRIGTQQGIGGQLSTTLETGLLSWSGDLRIGSGSMITQGIYWLQDMYLQDVRLGMTGVDIAAMMDDDPGSIIPSRISASLSGSAKITDWRTGRGELEVRSDSLQWDMWNLSKASTRATWEQGRGLITLDLQPADSSRMILGADLISRGSSTRIASRSLLWQALDLRSVIDSGLPASVLNGEGALEIDISGSVVDRVDIRLESASSSWGTQRVSDAALHILGSVDELSIEAVGRSTPHGMPWQAPSVIQVDALLSSWQEETVEASGALTFTDLDPAAFTGSIDDGTALNGQARMSATIDRGVPTQASFEVVSDSSSIRGEPVEKARIEGSLSDSVLTASAQITFAEGRLDGQTTVRPFSETPSFESSGTVRHLNLLSLLGRQDLDSDVNLTWDAYGSSLDPSRAKWSVEVMGQPSRLDALEIQDLSLKAGWDGNVLDVTELSTLMNVGTIQVNGRLNMDPTRSDAYSDLRATWYADDLNAFERLVGLDRLASRSGTVDMQVFGPAGQLDAELLVSVSSLEVDTWQLSSFEASGWFTLDEEWLPASTTANIDLGYISLPTMGVRTTSFTVGQRGDIFTAEGATMVDMGNRLAFEAMINPFADRPWIALRDIDLMLGGATFELERPSNLIIDDGWQLSRLALASTDQFLAVAGGLDSTGYGLQVELGAFDVYPIGQMTGYPELEGRFDATVLLSGRPKAPLISSQIAMDLTDRGSELARIVAHLQSTPQGVLMDGTVLVDDIDNLSIHGFIPIFAGLGIEEDERADRSVDLDLSIRSDGGSIRWFKPFVDSEVLADIDGRVTADIKVRGSIDDPFLSGFLNLENAQFRLPELGVTYRMDQLRSTLDGITIAIDEARLRSGDGAADITGSIDFASLTNSSFDLQAQLNRFRAVRNDELHTTISGDLQLTGRTTRPDLFGRLSTSNTSFWITDTAGGDVMQVPLSFDDKVMLSDNFGYRTAQADTLADAIWKGLSMELSVVLERDTWIRQRVNPEMAVELAGRLEIQKDRGDEDLILFRSIEVVPDRSVIKQFGRNFRITEGVASFNGPVEEMLMQVEAEYEVPSRLNPGQPEVVVTLRLDGRLDDLAFNLSSDPAMDNTDIVSYIATGRPASESLQFGGTEFNNQVIVGVAAAQLAGIVEGIASQSLGLDVVSIEQDGLNGTRLTAGKYVTPRLFVGVTHPITFSSDANVLVDEERELTLEYKVLEYLLLQLLADASDSPVRLNLAGRYAY